MSEEEMLDIKRENYKLRKENFELIQDNAKLNDEINILKIKLKEKICFEANSQFKDLKNELEIYKKIAEKLAEISRCVNVSDDECHKKTCEQCVIDWARKEVEKNNE